MVDWFWRRRRGVPAPRLRSREDALPTARIDLHEFAPAPAEFLARAAYVQLAVFEHAARAAALVHATEAKATIALAAGVALDRHRALVELLAARGADPVAEMERVRPAIDRFLRLTEGRDWVEAALTCHLAGGFLDDLFVALADGLPRELATEVLALFAPRADPRYLELFTRAMEDNTRLAARLALWGRRLLGDALLVARDALAFSDDHRSDEARIEPAFSELVANHTRRMDALGLAA